MRSWSEYPELANRAVLEKLINEGLPFSQIAERVGCPATMVAYAARKHGLHSRFRSSAPLKCWFDVPELKDAAVLAGLIDELGSFARIATHLHVSAASVKKAAQHHGLTRKYAVVPAEQRRRLRM